MQTGELFPVVVVALLTFGVGYNWLVGWLEDQEYDHGYTAFLVIGGTLVTLAGASLLVGRDATLLVLACFVASGTPMTVGSVWRYMRRRDAERRQLTDEIRRALNGDT
jgi:hypothetical protein